METTYTYKEFLEAPSRRQWTRIGSDRRAGVAIPLFSIYSKKSIGIGEFLDLKFIVDWCLECQMSIIQLLPLNDVGFDFAPYSAQSSFALDPMYLSLENLTEVSLTEYLEDLSKLRENFKIGGGRVNYKIKAAKLKTLYNIFTKTFDKTSPRFQHYIEKNAFWLQDYALYKTLKETHDQSGWESWPSMYQQKNSSAVHKITVKKNKSILFHQWLQWQCYEQMKSVKEYANRKKVFLKGDVPFLVARDSADVWAHQDYFKLNLSAGAPPDLYFANGQRWGMPPYNWNSISKHNYDYLIQKLKYAENFFDIFRVDHVIGVFRVFTIDLNEPKENAGLNGQFDPSDESHWEEHGRNLLKVMLDNTDMLPCGEDLGVVPACSYKVLSEFSLPGIDVPRWTRDWGNSYDFMNSTAYRKNAVVVLSTHDMCTFNGWWTYEVGTVDKLLFRRKCEERGIDFDRVTKKLFDLENSRYGRLLWRKDIKDISILLWNLEKPEHEVSDFVDMYKSTFDEEERYEKFLGITKSFEKKLPQDLIKKALEKSGKTSAIFCIQFFQDYLALGNYLTGNSWDWRINTPGSISPKNWSLLFPVPLEKLKTLSINKTIREINQVTHRQ